MNHWGSLPSREAWIEILPYISIPDVCLGRFPRGKRGLKFPCRSAFRRAHRSLPSREAWIEIHESVGVRFSEGSLPSREAWIEIKNGRILSVNRRRFPRGKRGLKFNYAGYLAVQTSRFPRGKRGLKLMLGISCSCLSWSLPSREAWIEIHDDCLL